MEIVIVVPTFEVPRATELLFTELNKLQEFTYPWLGNMQPVVQLLTPSMRRIPWADNNEFFLCTEVSWEDEYATNGPRIYVVVVFYRDGHVFATPICQGSYCEVKSFESLSTWQKGVEKIVEGLSYYLAEIGQKSNIKIQTPNLIIA